MQTASCAKNVLEATALLSASGELLYASPSATEWFGYLPDEILGQNPLHLIHPDDRLPSRRAARAALTLPQSSFRVNLRVRRKEGGWCWVQSLISSLRRESGVGAIVVRFREIRPGMAARKPALAEADDRTPADVRLEDFANAVAHDLQEPLRTISTCTELFLREMNVNGKGGVQAQFIRAGVARMSVLLEGLRAFALSGFEEPQPDLNLGQVVNDVLLDLRDAIGISGAIVTVGPLPFVRANERHLQRVLQNLIVNAIKYRSQGRVEIDVSAELLGADWMIRITDNGVGIAPEYHEQIFVLFKRLHGEEIPGAGIGLAICAKLIQAAGGAIWVESKAGSGASFCFTLPAAVQPIGRAVAA